MSPRAAWRLESLGFSAVYDYVPGKADWFAAGLPREGARSRVPVLGDLAHRDAPRCHPHELTAKVWAEVETAGWDQCVVIAVDGTVLGRIRKREALAALEAPAGEAMQEGPSTFRANVTAGEMARYMGKRGRMRDALVTDPEGRLIGVVRRDDVEAAAQLHHESEGP